MKKNKITWFLILLLSFILLIGSTVEYNMSELPTHAIGD